MLACPVRQQSPLITPLINPSPVTTTWATGQLRFPSKNTRHVHTTNQPQHQSTPTSTFTPTSTHIHVLTFASFTSFCDYQLQPWPFSTFYTVSYTHTYTHCQIIRLRVSVCSTRDRYIISTYSVHTPTPSRQAEQGRRQGTRRPTTPQGNVLKIYKRHLYASAVTRRQTDVISD